ncbi:MAG: NAD(P)-dependent oxidoreductase [Proteobacteria bacterium]|nr:NAD(P)-dependent oxidoreductase [Pseudomonadota bacterium]
MSEIDPHHVAFIGFGEVGRTFSQGLVDAGYRVTAYDLLLETAESAKAITTKAEALGVAIAGSAAAAAGGAQVVISAVTASSANEVAKQGADYLRPHQLFLDVNSVSPNTKRANAAAVERSGAHYVEAAVMAPVAPSGLRVPILLGGKHAAALKEALAPARMNLEIASEQIGKASAIKMCRSIVVKGLEAITVECLLTARHYGVEDDILTSLDKSYPGFGWEKRAGYFIGRTVEHGRRRAAEMREAAATIAETGLDPLMAAATAERQDWVADRAAAAPDMKRFKDSEWRAVLDAIVAAVSKGMQRAG